MRYSYCIENVALEKPAYDHPLNRTRLLDAIASTAGDVETWLTANEEVGILLSEFIIV